ncbi:thermonuclease family protein [Limnobacter sp.]|uniref:thermonuclease family protein n=1 Tax=Limnobacter sp. TaxID=2003368 RepID=UPI0035114A91
MSKKRFTILNSGTLLKVLALAVALLGVYASPYGPGGGGAQADPNNAKAGSLLMGTVIRVADGDTLTVRDVDGRSQKIRMHAVDAPELQQAHGEQAQQWLSAQVLNKPVKIVINNTDRYKRVVGKVVLPGEPCGQALCPGDVDINLLGIEQGHLWWYRNYANTQSRVDRQAYEAAENLAREQKLGLWGKPKPQAPWEWRSQQRLNQ